MTTLSEFIRSQGELTIGQNQEKQKNRRRLCTVIIGTMEVHAILKKGMVVVADLSTSRPQHAILMAIVPEKHASSLIKKRTIFLENRTMGFRPPPPQPWEMLMNVLGLHGQSRRGNQRRY